MRAFLDRLGLRFTPPVLESVDDIRRWLLQVHLTAVMAFEAAFVLYLFLPEIGMSSGTDGYLPGMIDYIRRVAAQGFPPHSDLGIFLRLAILTLLIIPLAQLLLKRTHIKPRYPGILFVLFLLAEVFLSDSPEYLFHSESVLFFCVPIIISAFVVFPWASFVTAAICALAVAILTLPGRHAVPPFAVVLIVVYFMIAASAWIGSRTMVTVIRKAHSEAGKFKAILASAGDGIIVLDSQGRISLVNPIVAFLMEEPIGRRLDDFFGNTLDRETNEVLRNLTNPDGWTGIIKSGGRSYLVNASPLAGGGMPDAATVVTLRDITAEREVTVTRNSLLRTVSHEMRTPVTVIEMSAEALLDGAFPEPAAQREVLTQIVNGARQLGGLIRDILDQARLDMGTIRPVFRPVDPQEILQVILGRFQGEARRVGLELSAHTDQLPPPVLADRDRLLQVLGNLVENAIKFTPQGSISLHLRAGDGWWGYDIVDTGIGISEEHREEIWKPFHVVDRSLSRPDQHGGLGLGLAIVSGLVCAMGGEIELESTIGQGSIFRLRLPEEVSNDQTTLDCRGG